MFIYAFIMLKVIRKIIKIRNYVRNYSSIAPIERKLLNTTDDIFAAIHNFLMTRTR